MAAWYLMENQHLQALSNASAESTRSLLTDLENYRVAVTRIVNIPARSTTPRTPIIIFRDRRAFAEYGGFGALGYVIPNRANGVVVMPIDAGSLKGENVIRHEYVHILTLDVPVRYPRWYSEGIAEVLSLAALEPDKGLITFGLGNGRERHVAKGLDRFDERLFDGITPVRSRTDPYWYFWLVTHYLTFGRPDLRPNLERYLVAREIGQPHVSAFKQAFGKSLTDMWNDEITPYVKAFPTFQMKMDYSAADLSFRTRPAPPEVVSAAFTTLREYRDQRKSTK